MTWADGENNETFIFWLSGWAGTGKSTIARTVAREYYNRGYLGANFFFSRGKEDISHAGKFFTSIAVQLAENSPALGDLIRKAISSNPSVASQVRRDQWNCLDHPTFSQTLAECFRNRRYFLFRRPPTGRDILGGFRIEPIIKL